MKTTTWVLLAFGAFAATGPVHAARITFVVDVPASTPKGAEIWISGDRSELGAWNGAGVRLEPDGERRYRAIVEIAHAATIAYKITRGGWETVEKGAHGEAIANRTSPATGDRTVHVTVAAWRDQVEPTSRRRTTRSGTIHVHHDLASQHVRSRDVLVYLPPGYQADSTRYYPVLYFHDGRNVFDEATSFLGVEWGVDETAERLIRAFRVRPFIAVAIDNTQDRMDEYTPAIESRRGGGRADDYARFLIEELMPMIDARYRTAPGAANTGVVGSSLGGVLSLYLGIEHPDRFGLIGCVSPAAWWAGRDIVRRAAEAPRGLRLWVDVGTDEGTSDAAAMRWLDDARALRDALIRAGYEPGPDLHYEEVAGAKHSERAWAARIDRILTFLLGPPQRPARPGAPGSRH